jgi:hypothetical protein
VWTCAGAAEEVVLGGVREHGTGCGEVTKMMGWTSPAMMTTRFLSLDATSWVPASSSGFSAGGRDLLRPVQQDVRHVLAVVGPGKAFRRCCGRLDDGSVGRGRNSPRPS